MPYQDVTHILLYWLSMCSPDWVDKFKMGYEDDPAAMQILTNPTRDFSVKDGLIRHQGRIWLGSNALAQQHVLQAVHNSGVGDIQGSRPLITESKTYFLGQA